MSSTDIFVQNYFALHRTSGITEFFYLLTILFDFSAPFILICLCVAILVYIVRNTKYAMLFVFSLLTGGILIYFLKLFFNVARPPDGVMYVVGQSFPSGHSTIATIFFVMLMYIFDDYLEGFWKLLFNGFCVAMTIFVAFSRIYLGVHWLSDVVGGVVLGLLVSYVFIISFKKFVLK